MIADATIIATTFGFVAGDMIRRGTFAGNTKADVPQNRSGGIGRHPVSAPRSRQGPPIVSFRADGEIFGLSGVADRSNRINPIAANEHGCIAGGDERPVCPFQFRLCAASTPRSKRFNLRVPTVRDDKKKARDDNDTRSHQA
jgi:hypothetical protein